MVMHNGFSDTPEQMSFSNRELKIAKLEQDPKVGPENTATTVTLMISGAESLTLQKIN